jgi:membrane protease YdiL (CAAX protease family)
MSQESPQPAGKASDAEVFGVWVFALVVILPAVTFGLQKFLYDALRPSFHYTLSILASAISHTAVVAFVIWKAGISADEIGLTKPRWLTDVLLGAVLAVIAWVLYRFSDKVAGEIRWEPSVSGISTLGRPIGWFSWGCAIVGASATAFSEELAFRGFLVSRLERILESRAWAVLAAAAAFGVCNLYRGAAGFVGNTLFGVLMCMAFLTCRRIWPGVVAHFLVMICANSFAPVSEFIEDDFRRGTLPPVDW